MPLGGAIIGAGALSAGASVWGASTAAKAQTEAANAASGVQERLGSAALGQQQDFFNVAQGNLAPWISYGQEHAAGPQAAGQFFGKQGIGYANMLNARIPQLTATFNPTIQQLEQTPGYQFVKDQGLKGVQNSYAAQGLGASGAAEKGAVDYAEGLAGTTFQQQFQNYLAQNQQQFNMLYNPASGFGQMGLGYGQLGLGYGQLGANAAAGVGNAAMGAGAGIAGTLMGTGNAVGQNTIGAGNAQGGAAMAMGTGIGNAASTGLSSYLQYNLLQKLMGGGSGQPGGGVVSPNLLQNAGMGMGMSGGAAGSNPNLLTMGGSPSMFNQTGALY